MKEFHGRIKEHRICLVIGSSASKTAVLSNLMFEKKDIPEGIVMSPTEPVDHFYADKVPQGFVYDHFSEPVLEARNKRQSEKAKGSRPGDSNFVILDDCLDNAICKSKLIRDWFFNGRYRKVFLIIYTQYCLALSIELRVNVDYVFCLKVDSFQEKETLYKQFFGLFPDLDCFVKVLDKVTEDGVLVLDNTIKSRVVEDKVFYWKPQPKTNFRMGSDAFWIQV